MATGLQAEKAVAEASGMPLVTVSQIARELRLSAGDLWLRTGSGRRIAHVSVRHLVSLSLGVALGPPSRALANVTMFRSLSTAGVRDQIRSEDAALPMGQIVDGNRLGEYLENFIRAIAAGELSEDTARLRKQFSLVLTPMHWDARVIWRGREHKDFDHIHTFRNLIELSDPPTAEELVRIPTAPQIGTAFEVSTTLRYPFFEVLADLLRDGAQFGSSTSSSPSSSPSPASDGPESKNAAPARAASRRPRVTTVDARAERRHPIPDGEQGQGTRGLHNPGDPNDPADTTPK